MTLDMKEFTNLIMVIDKSLNPTEIAAIFQKFDVNGDGNISFGEFKKLIMETDYEDVGDNHMLIEYRAKKLMK